MPRRFWTCTIMGIFQQRYVKRHGTVATDTVPSHEKCEALDP
jgi:hypothetical protein